MIGLVREGGREGRRTGGEGRARGLEDPTEGGREGGFEDPPEGGREGWYGVAYCIGVAY